MLTESGRTALSTNTGLAYFPSIYRVYHALHHDENIRNGYVSCVSLLIAITLNFSPDTPGAFDFANGGVTESIGIMAFAYMCSHNSFLLYESMENPTEKRWNRVTHISLASSCFIVLLFGVSGYVTFTGFTQGDLLENYCMDDGLAAWARLLFTITIMLTYPIECFVVRDVIENVSERWNKRTSGHRSYHIVVTSAIVFAAFLLSTLTDCLGIVLELNGILAALPLAYIIPAATYLKLDPGRLWSWEKFPAFVLGAWGVVVAIAGIIMSVLNVMNGVTCSHGAEMPYCTNSLQAVDLPPPGFANSSVTFGDPEVTTVFP